MFVSEDRVLAKIYSDVANQYLELAENGENMNANLQSAIDNYLKCERIDRTNNRTKDLAVTLHNLGNAYLTLAENGESPQRNLQLAIDYCKKAKQLCQKNNCTNNLISVINILDNTYATLVKNEKSPQENLSLAIDNCKKAKNLRHTNNWTKDLAKTIHNLGNAYLTLDENGELAIGNCKKAKNLRRQDSCTNTLIYVLNTLGATYSTLARNGESPQRNLQLAIENYKKARKLCRSNNSTKALSGILHNLGNADLTLAKNGKLPQRNLRLAIESSDDSTKVLSSILHNLGNAYLALAENGESPQRNLQLAIDNCKEAKQLRCTHNWTKDLAKTLNILGDIYLALAKNKKSSRRNLQLAIENSYGRAEKLCRKNDWFKDLANTLHNLGEAYLALAESGKLSQDNQDNLRLAIGKYEEAKQLCRKNDWPKDLANNLHHLGKAYLDLAKSRKSSQDNQDDLQLSVKNSEKAKQLCDGKGWNKVLTNTLHNLGSAYVTLAESGELPQKNLRLAIENCEEAKRLCHENNLTENLTDILYNLGYTYVTLAGNGESPQKNLRLAIENCEEAENRSTKNLISILNILSVAYLALARTGESPQDNLLLAIEYRDKAKRLCSKNNSTEDLIYVLNNSSGIHVALARNGESPQDNLLSAIEDCEEAKKLCCKNNPTILLSHVLNNLGSAYTHLARNRESPQDKRKNLQLAIENYKEAEEIRRYSQPFSLATTLLNLGIVYEDKAKLDRDNSDRDYNQALNYYRKALESFRPTIVPADCFKAARALGNLAFNRGWWKIALEGYGDAVMAIEQMRTSLNEGQRQKLTSQNIDVYDRAIYAAAKLGWHHLMVNFAERGRSRQFVDAIYSERLVDDDRPLLDDVVLLRAKLQHIQRQIDSYRPTDSKESNDPTVFDRTVSLRSGSRQLASDPEIVAELQQLHLQYQDVLAQIRELDPVFAQQIAVDILDFEQIRKLIPNSRTAILYCYTTDNDTYIIPILSNTDEIYIHTAAGEGYRKFQQWLNGAWVQQYEAIGSNASRHEWHEQMPKILAEISQRLRLIDVCECLSRHQIEELIIVPHLELHQIPWAAIPVGEGLLGDRFVLRTIPSCQMLDYFRIREDIADEDLQRVVFANPDGSLIWPEYEGKKIGQLFGIEAGDRYIRERATVDNYLAALAAGKGHLLSSHHGKGNRENPLQSALILANGEKITVGTLLVSRFPQLREVFLSACETNIGRATVVDDLITLGTGFLSAGANNVISTLWAVEELAASLLTIFYYRSRHTNDDSPAVALQAAQKRLRTISGAVIKAAYYDELMAHIREYAQYTAEQEEISEQQKQPEEAERWAEYNKDAVRMKIWLQEIVASETPPFESPWYWAGFICQGKG
jgi:CHAT domain-containing protein